MKKLFDRVVIVGQGARSGDVVTARCGRSAVLYQSKEGLVAEFEKQPGRLLYSKPRHNFQAGVKALRRQFH